MEWIKVSDRKPEKDMSVLITYSIEIRNGCYVSVADYAGYNADKDVFEVWDEYYGEWQVFEDVIAWMPFPDPYNPN